MVYLYNFMNETLDTAVQNMRNAKFIVTRKYLETVEKF